MEWLTPCLLGNFQAFLPSADFFQIQLFRKILSENTIRVSNSLDPDQARRFVGPDLGPNCLQRLSAEDTSSQKFQDLIIWSCIITFLYCQILIVVIFHRSLASRL